MTLVEQCQPALDALECLDALPLQVDQDALGVLVGTAADLLRLALAVADDLARALLGGTRQLALLDQVGRLLLGAGSDPLGLLLGTIDDALVADTARRIAEQIASRYFDAEKGARLAAELKAAGRRLEPNPADAIGFYFRSDGTLPVLYFSVGYE